MISGQTKIAAVIGDPVSHSLSPRIHNAAFAELGLDWVYVALGVSQERGTEAIRAMRTLGLSGMNVTMPHKAAIAATVDRRTPAASKLGACNCVYWDGDELVGDNTDGDGFVAALHAETGVDVRGLSIGVVGAGGAAKAIIDAFARHGAGQILVVNRSEERAAEAANLAEVASVSTAGRLKDVDVLVNATSVGMGANGGVPIDIDLLQPSQIVADIVYQPLETPLLQAAKAVGAQPIDGLGMLVHQAAASFERFTGVDAPLAVMNSAVRSHFGSST